MDLVLQTAVEILRYNQLLAEMDSSKGKVPFLWPCFIGETGTGKTARAEQLSKIFNMPHHSLLLQTMDPIEIGGAPRARGGKLVWHLDSWTEKQGIIFLDELDKPDKDHYSAVLSMLTDRRIRHVKLENALFVAAMQPVERELFLSHKTRQALSARLVFLPVNEVDSFNYVCNKHYRIPIKLQASEYDLPVLDKISPRQLDWLLGFYDYMTPSPEVLNLVVRGVVHSKHVKTIMKLLEAKTTGHALELGPMLRVLAKNPSLVDKADFATISMVFTRGVTEPGWTPEVLEKIMRRVLTEVEIPQIHETLKQMLTTIVDSKADANEARNMFEPLTFEQWTEVMNKVVNSSVDFYMEKYGDKINEKK